MSKISRKDRVVLEALSEEYGVDLLASAIITANNEIENNERTDIVAQEPSPADMVLDYIKRIEGYRIRIREFHWDAKNNSLHKLADSLMSDLVEYEDSIAEDFMGIIGYRIQVGTVIPKLPKSTEIKALLNEMTNDALLLKKYIGALPLWSGITSLIDECIHLLNKSKYLAELS